MDWKDLLHSLRDLLAQHGSTESEKHVLDLLKERTTDNELYSRGQTLDDWQLDQAKIVACDILRDHPDLLDIIRNLGLKSLCDRRKAAHLPAHKNRNREQLLQSVNVLVSSGKLVAAEELLEEELAENEDPELLDLLGRVYVLQSRPKQAAALMQQAFLAKRQQSVDQRAKMTRFPGFSASNFDHPGVCATIRSLDRRTWSVNHGNRVEDPAYASGGRPVHQRHR